MEHELAKKVALIADAAPDIGLGHLTRTGALATALRARGARVACHGLGARSAVERDGVTWEPLAPDDPAPAASLRVVDSYRVDPGELYADVPLVVMHDAATPPANAALVISVA